MKNFFVLAVALLSSVSAFAYPALNDSASYTGTYAEQGQSYPVVLTSTLKAFNAQTGQFLQNDVQSIAGQTQSQEAWVDGGDLLAPAQVQYLIANCQARGGALETISSTAGTFNTCKLAQAANGGVQTYWFADVPFGIAQILTTGTTDQGQPFEIALTLTSVTFGQ